MLRYTVTVETEATDSRPLRMVQRVTNLDVIRQNFETLGLPEDAANWLCDLWQATQFLDDAADGGEINRTDAEASTWALLVGLQTNQFYARNSGMLLPLVACQILKWTAANEAESLGQADHRSFMWRAGFYDVVAMVAHLCGASPTLALQMYGESVAEYFMEFPHA